MLASNMHEVLHSQLRAWFLHSSDPALGNRCVAVEWSGEFNIAKVRKVFAGLVADLPCLRRVFHDADGSLCALPLANPGTVEIEIWRAEDIGDAGISERLTQFAAKPFCTDAAPLLRCAIAKKLGAGWVIMLTAHRLIADQLTLHILLDDFLSRMQGGQADAGRHRPAASIEMPEITPKVASYISMLAADAVDAKFALPLDRARTLEPDFHGHSAAYKLTPDERASLANFCAAHDIGADAVLLAALLTVLYQYGSGLSALLTRLSPARGERAPTKSLGPFENGVPISIPMSWQASFMDLARAASASWEAARPMLAVPLDVLLPELRARNVPEVSEFTRLTFEYTDARAVSLGGSGSAEHFSYGYPYIENDLGFSVDCRENSTLLVLVGNAGLFDESTVATLLDYIKLALASGLGAPERKTGQPHDLGLADSPLHILNNPPARLMPSNDYAEFPMAATEASVSERFDLIADQYPENIAIDDGGRVIRYAELSRLVSNAARNIHDFSPGAGPVILLFGQGAEMIAAMLSVLRAGACYLPLDPSHSLARQRAIIDAAVPALVISDQANQDFAEEIAEIAGAPAVLWEQLSAPNPEATPIPYPAADDLAYIVFTSGSTGKPLGVTHSHRTLLGKMLIYTNAERYRWDEKIALVSSYSVGASQPVIYGALLNGGALLPFDIKEHAPQDLLSWMEANGITRFRTLPGYFRHFVRSIETARHLALRTMRVGSDTCLVSDFELFRGKFPPDCLFVNCLSSTEVHVTFNFLSQDTTVAGNIIPVGFPAGSSEIVLLNDEGYPTLGREGEIGIISPFLFAGYWNEPELTAARYTSGPDGRPIYRTGDFGRIGASGALEYLGRRDLQVKINGYRVNVAEVETSILRVAYVAEAVILPVGAGDNFSLTAFVVFDAKTRPGVPVSEVAMDIQERILAWVPDYMVPSQIVVLDEIPKTDAQKPDRRKLAELAPTQIMRKSEYVSPVTEAQKAIAAIWAELLGEDRIGLHDAFAEFGGDSLLATLVAARVRAAGYSVKPVDIIRYQSIEKIAPRAVAIDPPSSEDAPASGDIPISPTQAWFFAQEFTHQNHWNVGTLLGLSAQVDPVVLGAAVDAVIAHHGAFRHRFDQSDGVWRQRASKRPHAPAFFYHDLTATLESDLDTVTKELLDDLHSHFDIGNGPLARVYLLDFGSRRASHIAIAAHHLVFDGFSLRIFVKDLETAYFQILGKGAYQPAAKTARVAKWAEVLVAYAGSESLRSEIPYWQSQVAGNPGPLLTDMMCERNCDGQFDTHVIWLDPSQTERLLRIATLGRGLETETVLLTAFYYALRDWLADGETLSISMLHHGRHNPGSDIDVSSTTGFFMAFYPLILRCPQGATLLENIRTIADARAQVPNNGFGYGALRYVTDAGAGWPEYPPPNVTFNYQGQYDQMFRGSRLIQAPELPFPRSRGPENPQNDLVMNFLMRVTGGRFRLTIRHNRDLYTKASLEKMGENFRTVIEQVIA